MDLDRLFTLHLFDKSVVDSRLEQATVLSASMRYDLGRLIVRIVSYGRYDSHVSTKVCSCISIVTWRLHGIIEIGVKMGKAMVYEQIL